MKYREAITKKCKSTGMGYHKKYCKVCKQYVEIKCKMKLVKATPAFDKVILDNATKYHNATYKCKDCGYKDVREGEKHTGNHKDYRIQ